MGAVVLTKSYQSNEYVFFPSEKTQKKITEMGCLSSKPAAEAEKTEDSATTSPEGAAPGSTGDAPATEGPKKEDTAVDPAKTGGASAVTAAGDPGKDTAVDPAKTGGASAVTAAGDPGKDTAVDPAKTGG